MKPSERAKVIESIAGALCQMRNPIADLTLSQFGFPTSRDWGDDEREDYCISMLQNRIRRAGRQISLPEHDAALTAIHEHVSGNNSVKTIDPAIERRLWTPGLVRCFFSHTSRHKTIAASIKEELEDCGCDLFVAHKDIEPTVEWLPEIELALQSCHCLIALVTADFHASKWTDQEVGIAMGRGIPVVPIRAGEDPYGLMGKLQGIPFKQAKIVNVVIAIFNSLNSNNITTKQLAAGAVQAFLESASFASAKKRIGYVERLKSLTPELRRRLARVAPENNQIAEAFGVPARLKTLISEDKL